MSSAAPPSKGSPSILPTKSTVTPIAVLRRLALRPFGVNCAGLSARRSTKRSTSLVLDLGDRPLERDVLEIADLELRQHFDRDLEGEIAARLERRLDLLLVGRKFDLRLHGEAQAVLLDDLLVGGVDRLLDDVAP